MKRIRAALTVTLLFLALLLLAFSGTSFIAAPIWLVFRSAAGLTTAGMIAQIAAYVTMLGLFVSAAMIAIPIALEPASWSRKLLHVLPIYLLGLTIAVVLANIFGIATLGSIFSGQNNLRLSLASAALGVSAVLTTVALVLAAARANLSNRIQRAAMLSTVITVVPSLVLALAMLASVGIVMSNPSSVPGGGGPLVPPGAPPGGPGGDSGGLQGLVTQFEIGGGVTALFAIIALVSGIVGVIAWRQSASIASTSATPINYRNELGRALMSCGMVSVVIFIAIQLVPISRDNPPVLSTVQWDSPQTKDLVTRACMNCHSNETQWPWYATFAPGSWVTGVHVNSAREQFNLSELNKLPAFRKARLARDMADQIRNGIMPPIDFRLLHPESQLTAAEKEQLIQGLQNSIK